MHDFGYPCSMPREILVDGLFVDDSNHPDGYTGLYFFTDPDQAGAGGGELPPAEQRPFPYKPCRKLTVRGLVTASGKPPQLSPNSELQGATALVM
ncbi:MAG: hypothetical protein D6790_15995 [Caldilineae bacterium]|nr:MAG: hypothetical protein D6790_15995 [Caldilineae bacterium]